jgi:hypothetical protein
LTFVAEILFRFKKGPELGPPVGKHPYQNPDKQTINYATLCNFFQLAFNKKALCQRFSNYLATLKRVAKYLKRIANYSTGGFLIFLLTKEA